MAKYSCILPMVCLFFIYGCGKNNSTAPMPLANLTFTALVATDNSGNVTFSAHADNAVTYEFDFGNGVFQLEADGNLVYKYPASGTYTAQVTAKSADGKTLSKTVQVLVQVALKMVWNDEFDSDGPPAAAKWNFDIGTGSGGWGNNELQYYTDRAVNAYVSGGTLKIVGQLENFGGAKYTSARLKTQGKYSLKYGKVEMRAKLPTGGGTWPAFWMLGDNINTVGWPACGEIDIMEYIGNDPLKIFGTLHYPGFFGGNAVSKSTAIANASSAFHTFAVEWDASTIKFSLDGNVYHNFANNSTLPFNQNFFILINLAIGGNFGGTVSNNLSQAVYEIDYLRVYQ